MKITIIGPVYPYRGGIAHFTAMLAQAFSQGGHQVKLISFRGSYPSLFYKGKSTYDNSQKPVFFPCERRLDILNPITWVRTASTIEEDTPDVILIAWWTPYWAFCFGYLTRYFASKNMPVIYLVHNLLPHERHFFDLPLTRWAVHKATGMVVLSSNEQQKVEGLFAGKPVVTIPHPLYDFFLEGRLPKDEARKLLGLPLDKYIALFFGIVRPYKGLVHLLEATKRCRDRGLPILTVIAGEFWEDIRPTTDFIAQAGLEQDVVLHNRYIPNEAVNLYFSAADVFVAPYTGGTQSGAVKIAMSYKLPILTTRILATDETIQDYPNKIVVPPASGEALAHGLEGLLTCPCQTEHATFPGYTWEMWVETFDRWHKSTRPENRTSH